jgi:hypothetical protein
MFYLLVFIKIYFLLAFIPAFIAYFISNRTKMFAPGINFLIVYLIGFVVLMNFPFFDFINYLKFKQHSFQYLAQWSQSKSTIAIPDIGDTAISLATNFPIALKNMLLRPYIWEVHSLLWLIASIENILILIMIVLFLIGFKWDKSKAEISLFCLFFSLSILILTGLTTPVIGGLVRYKAPILPFFLMFFFYNFDFIVIKNRLRFYSKSIR